MKSKHGRTSMVPQWTTGSTRQIFGQVGSRTQGWPTLNVLAALIGAPMSSPTDLHNISNCRFTLLYKFRKDKGMSRQQMIIYEEAGALACSVGSASWTSTCLESALNRSLALHS